MLPRVHTTLNFQSFAWLFLRSLWPCGRGGGQSRIKTRSSWTPKARIFFYFSVQGGGTENSVPYTIALSRIFQIRISYEKDTQCSHCSANLHQKVRKSNKNKKDPRKPGAARIPIPCRFIPITVICSGWVKLRKKRPDSRAEWRDAKWDPIVQSSYVQVCLVTVEGLVCGFFLI